MASRSGAKDDQIRLSFLDAGTGVGEHLVIGQGEVPASFFHALRLLITDPNDLSVGMVRCHPQQIAHVKVVKINSCNLPAFHKSCVGFVVAADLNSLASRGHAECVRGAQYLSNRPIKGRVQK